MIDRAKYTIPHTPLPDELFANPDAFFSGDLLSGGQLLPLRKFRIDPHGRKYAVLVAPGDAIKVFAALDEDDRLVADSIEVNFPKLTHGHNGVALDEAGMLLALSRHEEYLAEIFGCHEIARRRMPGVTEDNPDCCWQMLEIAAQRHDRDGVLFRALKNATHPCSPNRYVSAGKSIRWGGQRSKTRICAYLKKSEMQDKHGERHVAGDDDVLRVEVVLKSAHLVRAFWDLNSPTVKIIVVDGEPRLVAFAWHDLVRVHQAVVSLFNGVFEGGPAIKAKDKTDEVGRFIAKAYDLFSDPETSDVHEWIELFGEVSGAATDRLGRIRGACLQELERSSFDRVAFADFFDTATYSNQPAVWVPAKERVTRQIRQIPEFSEAVLRAYAPEGFRPPGLLPLPGLPV